MKVLKPQLQQ